MGGGGGGGERASHACPWICLWYFQSFTWEWMHQFITSAAVLVVYLFPSSYCFLKTPNLVFFLSFCIIKNNNSINISNNNKAKLTIYISIYGNHINFKPIHFSSYFILWKSFLKQRLDICYFQVSSWHLPISIYKVGLLAVKFYSFAFEID